MWCGRRIWGPIMPQCSPSEAAALLNSGPLLLFAAQHVKSLDPDLSLAIAEARAAQEGNAWTPQIAQRLWSAYAKLCEAIDPVTMECLGVAQANIKRRKWFGGTEQVSLAERTSSFYSVLLIVLLVPLLIVQLYVWICSNQSKQIDAIMPQYKTQFATLTTEYTKLSAATANKKASDWTPDEITAATKVTNDAAALNEQAESIRYAARLLGENFLHQKSSLFSAPARPTAAAAEQPEKQWFDNYQDAEKRYNGLLTIVPQVQARANMFVGIFSSFALPILFATIGAIAYVIRAISDQINKTTFSSTSPIRHAMRVILGALAGIVVGLFNDLTTQFNLPQLAIAFLAGYGVEAVFSMFDNLIQKFR
jgi:hypothetical protein